MAISGNYTLTIPESAESADGISMLSPYSTTITFSYTQDDTDGDGTSDEWEGENGLNPNDSSDGAQDNDNDGLSNQQEYNEGTNPNSNDTDDDGMPDNWEVNNWTDPTVNDANEDDDNDGLTNIQEYQEGTDPQDSDTDGDGIPDGTDSAPLAAESSSPADMTMILILVLVLIGVIAAILVLKKKKGGYSGIPPEENGYGPQEQSEEFSDMPQQEQNMEEQPLTATEEGEDVGEMPRE
jgi:hypothetical protein